MARFMTDMAPGQIRDKQDFALMHSMTKKEKRSYQKRHNVLKRTIELAIAKCMRPDLIQACLHQLVATIYDFNYNTFNTDVLSKFIDHDGTLSLRKTKPGSSEIIAVPKMPPVENNIQMLIE